MDYIYNALRYLALNLVENVDEIYFSESNTYDPDLETQPNNIFIESPETAMLRIEKYPAVCLSFKKIKFDPVGINPRIYITSRDEDNNLVGVKEIGVFNVDLVITILAETPNQRKSISEQILTYLLDNESYQVTFASDTSIDSFAGLFEGDIKDDDSEQKIREIYTRIRFRKFKPVTHYEVTSVQTDIDLDYLNDITDDEDENVETTSTITEVNGKTRLTISKVEN